MAPANSANECDAQWSGRRPAGRQTRSWKQHPMISLWFVSGPLFVVDVGAFESFRGASRTLKVAFGWIR